MTGAEVIALVAVVSSALVGPSLTAAWGIARARIDSRREREDALVTVLEAAAIDMAEAYARLQDDASELTRGATAERRQELLRAQEQMFLGIWQHETKIALRLSTSADITEHYRNAAELLSQAGIVLAEVAAGEPMNDERRRSINLRSSEANAEMQQFLGVAAKRIGPGEASGLRRMLSRRRQLAPGSAHAAGS